MDIGANHLTNQQLYWVTLAFGRYAKFHRNTPKTTDAFNHLQMEYYHVYYKFQPGFQEAFKCNLTEEEAVKVIEYFVKRNKILEQNKIN